MADTPNIIYTLGHSNHPADVFLGMLKANNIELLADVRTIPRSRHNPHFNMETLEVALSQAHIAYVHMKELGGLRHANADSINTGFHNSGFRGYADYMQTEEFDKAVEQLAELGKTQRVAIMCAEAVPWRCHRSLIGDALLVRGIQVLDIFPDAKTKKHELTSFARVDGTKITYPPEQQAMV